jgi:phosphate transport system substrate-binding protein
VRAEPLTEPHATTPVDPALPNYVPEALIEHRMRSVGSDTMDRLMGLWEARFQSWHSGVELRHEGRGSGTAVPALAEGFAHFGPMSRALKDDERKSFLSEHGYEPMQVTVAMDAVAVFVNRENPVATRGLTLAELDAIFSTTRLAGHPQAIDSWGGLGLQGEWRETPIQTLGRNQASGTYGVFKELVMRLGAFKPGVVEVVGSAEVIDRIVADRSAIGYSGIGYIRSDVAVVPLAATSELKPVPPSPENVYDHSYPLARPLFLAIDLRPGQKPSPLQREFLRFVLSKQGQERVAEAGFYPLPAAKAASELKRLGMEPAPAAR